MRRSLNRKRRGASAIQVGVVMMVVAVGVISMVNSVGTNTDVELTDTAGRVGDPSSLPGKFAANYAPTGGGSYTSSGGTTGGGTTSGGTTGGGTTGGGTTGGGTTGGGSTGGGFGC